MDQPNKLPLYVAQEIRNANPQFSQLLDTITQHITQEGTRRPIHSAFEQVDRRFRFRVVFPSIRWQINIFRVLSSGQLLVEEGTGKVVTECSNLSRVERSSLRKTHLFKWK